MRTRSQDKRPVVILLALLLLPVVVGEADAVLADARVVEASSVRTVPESLSDADSRPTWTFDVGGGVSAGGDLFRVRSDDDQLWTIPAGGTTFTSSRFTVTLDESAIVSLGLARRMTARGWLRIDFSWTEMNATALAKDGEFVTPVLFDSLTMARAGLTWQQRLADASFSPYVVIGLCYQDVSSKAEYLKQSGLAPKFGMGSVYSLSGAWRVRMELTDTIYQFDSSGIQDEAWPSGTVYTELGPQHLVVVELGLMIVF